MIPALPAPSRTPPSRLQSLSAEAATVFEPLRQSLHDCIELDEATALVSDGGVHADLRAVAAQAMVNLAVAKGDAASLLSVLVDLRRFVDAELDASETGSAVAHPLEVSMPDSLATLTAVARGQSSLELVLPTADAAKGSIPVVLPEGLDPATAQPVSLASNGKHVYVAVAPTSNALPSHLVCVGTGYHGTVAGAVLHVRSDLGAALAAEGAEGGGTERTFLGVFGASDSDSAAVLVRHPAMAPGAFLSYSLDLKSASVVIEVRVCVCARECKVVCVCGSGGGVSPLQCLTLPLLATTTALKQGRARSRCWQRWRCGEQGWRRRGDQNSAWCCCGPGWLLPRPADAA